MEALADAYSFAVSNLAPPNLRETILFPIYATLLGTFLIWLTKYAYKYLLTRRGALTGTWTGFAFDDDGTIRKHDVYKARHRGEDLYVEGTRLYPPEQAGWKWSFRGFVRHSVLTGYFNSKDKKVQSMGCLMLSVNKDSTVCHGFYMTQASSAKGFESSSYRRIRQVKYVWVRGEKAIDEGTKYNGSN